MQKDQGNTVANGDFAMKSSSMYTFMTNVLAIQATRWKLQLRIDFFNRTRGYDCLCFKAE